MRVKVFLDNEITIYLKHNNNVTYSSRIGFNIIEVLQNNWRHFLIYYLFIFTITAQ